MDRKCYQLWQNHNLFMKMNDDLGIFFFHEWNENLKSHVLGSSGPKPVIRKHGARPEVTPVVVGPLDREVPVRERDGGVDRLQRLFVHESQRYVGRHEACAVVPVVAVPAPSCTKKKNV